MVVGKRLLVISYPASSKGIGKPDYQAGSSFGGSGSEPLAVIFPITSTAKGLERVFQSHDSKKGKDMVYFPVTLFLSPFPQIECHCRDGSRAIFFGTTTQRGSYSLRHQVDAVPREKVMCLAAR